MDSVKTAVKLFVYGTEQNHIKPNQTKPLQTPKLQLFKSLHLALLFKITPQLRSPMDTICVCCKTPGGMHMLTACSFIYNIKMRD